MTDPTPAAMRAARYLNEAGVKWTPEGLAKIIDRETGLRELVSSAEELLAYIGASSRNEFAECMESTWDRAATELAWSKVERLRQAIGKAKG